jgi:hypothetical protein
MAASMRYPVGANATERTTDARFALLTYGEGTSTTEWLYVQADGAITAYDTVSIDEDGQARPITAGRSLVGHRTGFAQAAFADDEYGWIAITGSDISARFAASCVADSTLYTTAVAGVLDDASATSQTDVRGLVPVTSISSATAVAEIIANWPQNAYA